MVSGLLGFLEPPPLPNVVLNLMAVLQPRPIDRQTANVLVQRNGRELSAELGQLITEAYGLPLCYGLEIGRHALLFAPSQQQAQCPRIVRHGASLYARHRHVLLVVEVYWCLLPTCQCSKLKGDRFTLRLKDRLPFLILTYLTP
ncbi:hypothetical protein D3C80_1416990 [compost metagenome]